MHKLTYTVLVPNSIIQVALTSSILF